MDKYIDTISLRRVVLFATLVALVASAGVASAAVAGSFSGTYDGYDDESDTSVRGHEIQVTGTLEFSGQSAVNPRIVIRSTENTVLDDSTVTLLQPGSTSANFNDQPVKNGIMYTADEISPGTTLNIEFVVYPVAGLTEDEINSAQVVVTYQDPSGEQTRRSFDVSTELSNSPPKAIEAARNQTPEPGLRDWAIRGLAVIGALVIALTLLMLIWNVISGDDDGSPIN